MTSIFNHLKLAMFECLLTELESRIKRLIQLYRRTFQNEEELYLRWEHERSLWKDGEFVTANIAASTDYLKNNSDVIKKLLEAHVNETIWINDHRQEAIKAFNIELKKLTGKTIPEDELRQAVSRIDFTYDPLKLSLFRSANNAYDLGFLAKGKPHPNLSGIFDLTILDEVLKEKGLKPVEGEVSRSSSGGNLAAAE
jgi:NitT/TauT family transport system substrate-binding protein